jgi:hypothetical protein
VPPFPRPPALPPFPRQPTRTRPLPDAVALRRLPLPVSAPPYDDQPEAGQAGTGQPAAGQAGPGQRRAGQAGTGQPAAGQAGTGQPAAGQAGTGQPAAGQAGTGQPAAGQAGPGQRRTGQAGPERGPGRPDTGQADTGQPGSGRADTAGRGGGPPGTEAAPAAGVPPGRPALVPHPGPWPSQFAQALAETLAGARPPQQLTSWTTQRARNRIRQLGPVLAAGPRPRVRRVLGCAPTGDVVELAVIVSMGTAVRAIAVRLERASPSPASPERATPDGARGGRPGRGGQDRTWLCTDIEAA